MNKQSNQTEKICVQCKRKQSVESFRPYYPRTKKAKDELERRKAMHEPITSPARYGNFIAGHTRVDTLGNSVSRYTICYNCETLNGVCRNLLNKEEANRTEEDNNKLSMLKKYYAALIGKVPAIGMRLLNVEANLNSTEQFYSLIGTVMGNSPTTDLSEIIKTASEESQKIIVALKERTYVDSDAALDVINANRELLDGEGLLSEALGLHADWEEETW